MLRRLCADFRGLLASRIQLNEVANLVDHPTNRQLRNRICKLQEWNKKAVFTSVKKNAKGQAVELLCQ
jgi:hypothetical protein